MSKKKKNKKSRKPLDLKHPAVIGLYKPLDTKGKVGTSAAEMLKSVGFGLLGTGIGMAIGKPSFFVGIGASLIGNYLDFQPLKAASIGLIATGGYQFAKGINGVEEDGIEGVKERLKAFSTNLKENLYLNKLLKPKAAGTNGLGDVQYFKYPKQEELDMGALDALEDEIAGSGEEFHEQISGSPEEAQILGLEEDRLY